MARTSSMARDRSHRIGLLAIFCDMGEEWHEEFRLWLSEDMFPARLRFGFPACASYDLAPVDSGGDPDGSQAAAPPFLTIYETLSTADLYGEPYQRLRRDRDPRDAAMHQRMIGIERYALSLVGPIISRDGDGLGHYVFVDRFDLRPADVQTFNIWFEGEYLPWCLKLSGLVRVRRYLTMEGAPRHFVLHEFKGMGFQEDPLWRALRKSREWTICAMTYGAPALYKCAIRVP
ncbi:MAG: hypothetical protein V3U53_02415 [bacterium]